MAELTPEQKRRIYEEALAEVRRREGAAAPGAAFLERAAGAATFGATDWLMRTFDPEGADAAADRAAGNPKAAFLGNVAGALVPGVGTAKLAAKATTALGGGAVARIGVNALEGGLYGLGSVVSEESLGDREVTADKLLVGARTGALLGGGLTAVGLGVSKAAQETVKRSAWLADKIDTYANRRAVKWLNPTKGELGKNADIVDEVGKLLHEEGLVGMDAASMVSKLDEVKVKTFDKQMGPFLKMGTNNKGFDMARVVKRIDDEILAPLKQRPDLVDAYNVVRAKRDQLAGFIPEAPTPAVPVQGELPLGTPPPRQTALPIPGEPPPAAPPQGLPGAPAPATDLLTQMQEAAGGAKPWAQGGNQFYISDVAPNASIDDLLALAAQKKIRLSRADLVGAMDPGKVKASTRKHPSGYADYQLVEFRTPPPEAPIAPAPVPAPAAPVGVPTYQLDLGMGGFGPRPASMEGGLIPPTPAVGPPARAVGERFETAAQVYSTLGKDLKNKAYEGKYEYLMDMRKILSSEITNQLEEAAGTGIGAKYAAGVKAYRVAAKAKDWAKGYEAAELKGTSGAISQGDVTLGVLGGLVAGGPAGVLAAAPGIALKTAGGPLGAIALKKAAPTIERLAASFGRFVDRGLASSNTWGGAFRNVLAAASSRGAMDALAAHTKLASNPEYMAELGLTPESPAAALGGVSRIAKLEAAAGIAEQVDAKIDVAINRFFGQQAGRAPAPAMGSPSARAKDFPKTFALLKEVTEKPEVLAQMLNFPDADSMPGVAAAMGQRYQAAVKHLLDTAPRNPDRSPVEALRQPWKPSEADLQRWYRRVEVVENPLQVLDDVRRGHVTPEAVETFKAVYAPLFQDLQERMMSRLATYEGKLSYRQRAALGQLFPDIGRGLEPAKAALVQGSHQSAMVAPKAPPGGGGDAAKGKAAESRFDNLLTESQRLEKR